MSKKVDFTQPGGIPVTQDLLAYLQIANTECIGALSAMAGNEQTRPFVVSGCVVTRTFVFGTMYDYSITAGWVCYNGVLIRVTASSVASVNEAANAVYMHVINTAGTLPYFNGSNPAVTLDSSISLMAQAIGTADDATHFLLAKLVKPATFSSEIRTQIGGDIINFQQNKYIVYNDPWSIASPLNIDMAGAVLGREVTVVTSCVAGETLSFSINLAGSILGVGGSLPALYSSRKTFKFRYVVNDGTFDIVTVEAYDLVP